MTEPRAATSVRWSIQTYLVTKTLTLLATIVLARLLVPSDFGVVMLAFSAINVVGLFGDLGLGATLVVRPDLDKRGLGTVLMMLVGAGALLGVVLVLIAPFLSDLFQTPRLGPVLTALAPLNTVASITWFYQWLLQRDLRFRQRFYGFMAQAGAYAAVALGSAATHAGVWSIVAGLFAGQVAMGLVFVIMAGPVRPAFDVPLARDLLRTSRGFMLQNGAMLVLGQADYVSIGRTLGATQVGLYSMAFRLCELPYLGVADPVTKVTFPTFSRLRTQGISADTRYLEVLQSVALITCPIGIGLSAVAEPFTRVLYGPRWVPMIGALEVLGVWGAARCVKTTVEWMAHSVGGSSAVGTIAFGTLILQVPLLFVAAATVGIAGVAWVLLGGVAVSFLLLVGAVRHWGGIGFRQHWHALWPVAAAGAATWLAARAVLDVGPSSPFAGLISASAVGAVVYIVVVSALARGSILLLWRRALEAIRLEGPLQPAKAVPDDS
jgi:PST family polysaccharide transporter